MSSLNVAYVAVIAYETPIRALYRADPTLRDQPFDIQLGKILDLNLVYSNKFAYGMEQFGHRVENFFFNLFSLQRAWAREHIPGYQAPTLPTPDELLRILVAQIRHAGCEVVVLQGLDAYPKRIGETIKRECPGVRLVLAQTGWRFDDEHVRGVDVLILNAPLFLEQGRRCCPVVHLMYHSFDPRVVPPDGLEAPEHFFTFSGSSGYALSQHRRRYWSLLELMLRADLQGWLNDPPVPWDEGAASDFTQRLADARGLGDGALRKLLSDERVRQAQPPLPLPVLFPERCHSPVYGTEMYQLLARSGACLNVHTDLCDSGFVGNIRLFEVTGMGSCLVTDDGANLRDLFEPDHEVVTYRSLDECVEKVNYLREHEDERRRIAAAGRRRTLAAHTIVHRCAEIDDIMRRLL